MQQQQRDYMGKPIDPDKSKLDKYDPNARYDLEGDIDNLESMASSQTVDESLAQAITVLTEEDRRKLLSELEPREVFMLTMLQAQAHEFDDDLLQNICDNFLVHRISKERKGRKEIFEIAKANLMKSMGKSWIKRLLKRGGNSGDI
jgi:hypothetical protein